MANLAIIKDLCKDRGISVRKLAECLGWRPSTLQAMIDNNSTKIENLERIAEFFGVSVSTFFGEPSIFDDIRKAWECDRPKTQKIIDNIVMASQLFEQINKDNDPELLKKLQQAQHEQLKGTFDNPLLMTLTRLDKETLERWVSCGFIPEDFRDLVKLYNDNADKVKIVVTQPTDKQ